MFCQISMPFLFLYVFKRSWLQQMPFKRLNLTTKLNLKWFLKRITFISLLEIHYGDLYWDQTFAQWQTEDAETVCEMEITNKRN